MGRSLVAMIVATLVALPGRVSSEKLVWSDEFNTLNQSKWSHMVTAWDGGNLEFQYYRNSRNNSYTKDGVLYIRPTWTSAEYGDDFLYNGSLSYPDCTMDPCTSSAGGDIVKPILSARMTSNYAFKYGRVVIRAKMPRGDWLWPAIWMLPKDSVYGGWPMSGEIDILETKGNADYKDSNGVNQGSARMCSTLHWGVDYNHNNYWRTHWEKSLENTGRDLADDFHNYGMEWSNTHIRFTFDGHEIGIIKAPQKGFWYFANFQDNPGGTNIWRNGNRMAPFDQEFQLILNVAVGGIFFPDNMGNRPWSWNGHSMRDFWENRSQWLPTWHEEDAAMKIDYIRVYK